MDHTRDHSGRRLAAIALNLQARGVSPPDYVKQADRCPQGRRRFADPVNQAYPLDTPADVWLSAAFYGDNRAAGRPAGPAVQAELVKAAAYHGIAADVEAVLTAPPLPQTPVDYADADGRLPLRHGADVKAAAEWLELYRDQLPYRVRRGVAEKVLAKAAALTVTTGREDFLQKTAGLGHTGDGFLVKAVEAREQAARVVSDRISASTLQAACKLAAAVRATPGAFRTPETSLGLVEALEAIDRELGHGYGPGYPRPEDAVYGATAVKAAEVRGMLFAWPDGREFILDDLAALPAGTLGGPECGLLATDPKMAAEAYATADTPRRTSMNEAMSRNGIRPVVRWLDRTQLEALA